MVVQWLRLCAPTAGGLSSIPGWGTRSHMPQLRVLIPQLRPSVAKLKKKKRAPEPSPPWTEVHCSASKGAAIYSHSLFSTFNSWVALPFAPKHTILLNYLLWSEAAWAKIEFFPPEGSCPCLALALCCSMQGPGPGSSGPGLGTSGGWTRQTGYRGGIINNAGDKFGLSLSLSGYPHLESRGHVRLGMKFGFGSPWPLAAMILFQGEWAACFLFPA